MSKRKSDRQNQQPTNKLSVLDAECDWWDAPIPNRQTAAYHIGRLLNQLSWHLQHVLVFGSSAGGEMVDRVLGQLTAATYKLTASPPNRLAKPLDDARARWKRHFCCVDAREEVYEIVSGNSPELDDETTTDSFQRLVKRDVIPFVAKLRDSVLQGLAEPECWAMELGRSLDEGIRRPDIFRFFDGGIEYIIDPAQPESDDPYRGQGKHRQIWRKLQPGELEPDPAWPNSLRHLVAQTGLPVEDFAAILQHWKQETPRGRLDSLATTIESIDQKIRMHLTGSVDRLPADQDRSSEQPNQVEHQSTIARGYLSRMMTKKKQRVFTAAKQ